MGGKAASFAAMDSMEVESAPEPMMKQMVAEVSHAGDLGGNYVFRVTHHVNISSASGAAKEGMTLSSGPRRLLINTVPLTSTIFSYAVPSVESKAYLRAWGALPSDSAAPILRSDVAYRGYGSRGTMGGARVFLHGTYVGETSIPGVEPGSTARLSLGVDNRLEVRNTPILPKHGNVEEDKSTWFVTDKAKFRVKTEEFSIYAKSSHDKPILAILRENVPVSAEQDITVDMQSPDPKALIHIDDTHASGAEDTNLEAVFQAFTSHLALGDPFKLLTFMCKESGNVYWVKLLRPGESLSSTLKYRIVWPEKRQISVY
jgi:hypothetical protein